MEKGQHKEQGGKILKREQNEGGLNLKCTPQQKKGSIKENKKRS